MRQAADKSLPFDLTLGKANLELLVTDIELALLKTLAAHPDCVANSARDFAPHNIASYLRDLAANLQRLVCQRFATKRMAVISRR